jgi:hypothetical protein
MSTLIAVAALPAKLAALTEPAEIVDEQGRKLGRYIPEPAVPEPIVPWDPSITLEERDRRADEEDDLDDESLAEFWKRMGRT